MDFAQTTQESPYKVMLQVFEGPLDLLLHLIRSHEIDIYDIPIAQITEQYLAHLALMKSLDLDVAGEWLVMAATLLEIKSRMLLPEETQGDDEDQQEKLDPRLELVERLIEYEKFKSAAEIFRDKEEKRSKVFIRGPVEVDIELRPTLDLEDITAADLMGVLQRILADVSEEDVTTIRRRKVTVRLKMREIWRRLTEKADSMSFAELFEDAQDKIEIVITFLALLELLRIHKVKCKQKINFGPIEVVAVHE